MLCGAPRRGPHDQQQGAAANEREATHPEFWLWVRAWCLVWSIQVHVPCVSLLFSQMRLVCLDATSVPRCGKCATMRHLCHASTCTLDAPVSCCPLPAPPIPFCRWMCGPWASSSTKCCLGGGPLATSSRRSRSYATRWVGGVGQVAQAVPGRWLKSCLPLACWACTAVNRMWLGGGASFGAGWV